MEACQARAAGPSWQLSWPPCSAHRRPFGAALQLVMWAIHILCLVILSEGAVGSADCAEVERLLHWQARSIRYRGPSTPQSSAFADDLVAQDDRRMKQVADKQSKSPPRDDDATRAYKPLQTKKEPHSRHPYADTAWFELKPTV